MTEERIRTMRLKIPGLPDDAKVDGAFVDLDGDIHVAIKSESFPPPETLGGKRLYRGPLILPRLRG